MKNDDKFSKKRVERVRTAISELKENRHLLTTEDYELIDEMIDKLRTIMIKNNVPIRSKLNQN